MLSVVLIVLAVAGLWAVAAVALAFVAGGVIHVRDHPEVRTGGPFRPLTAFLRPRS